MFKYYLLKIRYFLACVITVLLICSAVIVGGIVGLSDDRKQAVKEYEGSMFNDGIEELLVFRADSARRLALLYAEYLPENSSEPAAVEQFISHIQNETEIATLALSERATEEAIALMIKHLENKKLTSSNKSELNNLVILLNENHSEIVQSDYNKAALEYNDAINRFPGNIYAKYLSLEPLELFG